jgi:hypothetical protein
MRSEKTKRVSPPIDGQAHSSAGHRVAAPWACVQPSPSLHRLIGVCTDNQVAFRCVG